MRFAAGYKRGWFIGFLMITMSVHAQVIRPKTPLRVYESVDPERLINNLRDISSAAFEGRELGTDGNNKAANWMAFKMQESGLLPLFDGMYRQEFPVVRYGLEEAWLRSDSTSFTLNADFLPATFSASEEFGAELSYLGYGLGEDVPDSLIRGKVCMLTAITEDAYRTSQFIRDHLLEPGKHFAQHYKTQAEWAISKGAVAVLLVNPDLNDIASPSGSDYRYEYVLNIPARAKKDMSRTPSPFVAPERLEVPVFYLSKKAALSLTNAVESEFDSYTSESAGRSFAKLFSNQVAGKSKVKIIERSVSSNVGGIIHGKWSDRYLVIITTVDEEGQHPQFGYPYIGSNSNGSAIVSACEMARVITKTGDIPEYGIIVLAVNGSRRRQAGLSHFLENPPFELSRIKAAAVLKNFGSGAIEDSSSVHVSEPASNVFNFEAFLSTAAESINLNPKSYTETYSSLGEIPLVLADYGIQSVVISGGFSPFDGRISDAPDKMNFVKFYRLTQFGLEIIWQMTLDSRPVLKTIR